MRNINPWTIAAGVVVVVASSGILLLAQDSPPRSTRQFSSGINSRDNDDQTKLRLREGTQLVDKGGHFRLDGDGATFVTESQLELVALPNLSLERVIRTLKGSDESESIRWNVNGLVTEFSGRNYLLIQRAVYKSAAPPPVPESIVTQAP